MSLRAAKKELEQSTTDPREYIPEDLKQKVRAIDKALEELLDEAEPRERAIS